MLYLHIQHIFHLAILYFSDVALNATVIPFRKKYPIIPGLKVSLQVITVTPFPPDLVGAIEQSLQSSSFATVQQKAYVAELYFGLECYIKLETINGNLNFDVWLRAIFMISLENFKDAFIHFIRISQGLTLASTLASVYFFRKLRFHVFSRFFTICYFLSVTFSES